MTDELRKEFEATYRACFPIAAELHPNLFSFELDDGEYVEAKVHVAFTLWQAARATAEQRDSVIEEWIEETCAAYCIPKPFAIIDAIRALKSQQDAAIESKPAEQSEPSEPIYQVLSQVFSMTACWEDVPKEFYDRQHPIQRRIVYATLKSQQDN